MLNKSNFLALSAISIALAGCGSDDATNQLGSLTLSGDATEGETLSTIVFDSDGIDESTLTYTWFADGTIIDGATSPTYTLTEDEVGTEVFASVIYTDNRGLIENHSTDTTGEVAAAPEVFAGLTASIISTSTTVTGTITLADASEASLIAVTDQATSFGTFTLAETGAYTYTLNTEDATIVALESDETVTDSIVFEATDGEVDVLVITISGVAAPVAVNQAARIVDTAGGTPNDTGELRLAIGEIDGANDIAGVTDGAIAVGRFTVELFREAEENSDIDAFFAIFGDSTSSNDAIADVRLDTASLSYELRNDPLDTNLDGFALEELIEVEVQWDASNADVANNIAPVVTVTIDGVNAFSSPFSSPGATLEDIVAGVEVIQFRLAGSSDVTDFGYIVDNLTVYATDTTTDTESVVFSDSFETYTVGNSLDPDATAPGNTNSPAITDVTVETDTPYNANSFDVTVSEFAEGNAVDDAGDDDTGADDGADDGDTGATAGPGTAGNQFAAISDTSTGDTGELRLALSTIDELNSDSIVVGRLSVTVLKEPETSGQSSFISLFGGSTSSVNRIAELRLNTNEDGVTASDFELRDQDTVTIDVAAEVDQWYVIEYTWDATNANSTDTTPTFNVSIDGVPVSATDLQTAIQVDTDLSEFATGLENFQLRLAGGDAVASSRLLIDNLSIYSSDSGTETLIFSDDFETYTVGNSLDPDAPSPANSGSPAIADAVVETDTPYHPNSFEVVVDEEQ